LIFLEQKYNYNNKKDNQFLIILYCEQVREREILYISMDLLIANGTISRLPNGTTGTIQCAPIRVKYEESGIVHILSNSGTPFVTITPPLARKDDPISGRYVIYVDPLNVPYIDVGERKRKREEEERKKSAVKSGQAPLKKAKKDSITLVSPELEAKRKRKEERQHKRELKAIKAAKINS